MIIQDVQEAHNLAAQNGDHDNSVLMVGNFELHPTGLVIHGYPSFDDWRATGETLRGLMTSIQWALGDWLNYGEFHYGEKYSQALDETDYSIRTLQNYAYVAGRVETSRRREHLTFSHHAEVAALPPHEQNDKLNMAEQMGMSVRELRALIKTDDPLKTLVYTAQVVEIWGGAVWLQITDGDIEALVGMGDDPVTVMIKPAPLPRHDSAV